jgi:uncharacterized protein DUF4342
MSTTEEHQVSGEQLLAKVKSVIHEGNVRRIIIKNDTGQTIMEIPLSIGVVSAVLLPLWVAIGAIAALAAHYSVVVERADQSGGSASGGSKEIGDR